MNDGHVSASTMLAWPFAMIAGCAAHQLWSLCIAQCSARTHALHDDVRARKNVDASQAEFFADIVEPRARMAHGGDHNSTSTTVEVRRLSHPDFLIEVEVMAVIPER